MNQNSHFVFNAAKRSFDVLFSLAALILLLPGYVMIAVWIKLDSPGPVLYKSLRLGKDARPFTLYKFRTMYQHSQPLRTPDGAYLVLDDDPRVTRVGRILRTGLDELPQFFNVLLGQMSLIGPRADPLDAISFYTIPEKERLAAKPGISGLAQVNGRTRIPLSQRRTYDLAYIKNQSLQLDTCIFFLTLFELLPFLAFGNRRAQKYLSKTANRLALHTI